MAKITLDDITSSFASTSLFQSNFTAIEDELNDKVLYRDNPTGEANQMMNDLDMNSNDILNIDAIGVTSLTVNGTAITPNTNDQTLTYIDTEFTTSAGLDTFNATYTVGFVDVYYNGTLLADADYTATDGTSVVLTAPVVSNSDVITVRAFSAFSAGDGITQVTADGRYLQVSNNLSDLNSATTSRTNLGLGTAAVEDIQTSPTDATAGRLLNNETTHIGGEINYTGANFKTNVFEANAVGDSPINGSTADTATEISFIVPTSFSVAATDIDVVGQWDIALNTGVVVSPDVTVLISSRSGIGGAKLFVTDAVGLTAGTSYRLQAGSSNSKVELLVI